MAVIVFDVNETLLDLAGLDPAFDAHFGERGPEVKRLWFARLLHLSLVMSTLGTHQEFGVLGRCVLQDVAESLELPIDSAGVADVVGGMRELEAHPDVVTGVAALTAAGHRLAALTNSGQATAEAQLSFAGIDGSFERILSADATLRYKPDPAVYAHAATELDARPEDLILVAAHDWDCAGAMKAGWRTGFLARPGRTYDPLLQPPTWRAIDLPGLARAIANDR